MSSNTLETRRMRLQALALDKEGRVLRHPPPVCHDGASVAHLVCSYPLRHFRPVAVVQGFLRSVNGALASEGLTKRAQAPLAVLFLGSGGTLLTFGTNASQQPIDPHRSGRTRYRVVIRGIRPSRGPYLLRMYRRPPQIDIRAKFLILHMR